MPQPVRSRDPVTFTFRPEALLSQRPKLAAYLAVISCHWNDLEAMIGIFVASIVGGNPKAATAIFLAITNDGAKRAALDAICRLRLKPKERLELQNILTQIGARYADRNLVVHGGWGVSKKYPKKIVWADVRETVAFATDMARLMPWQNDLRYERLMAYQKTLMVYGEADLKAVRDRVVAAADRFHEFSKPFVKDFRGGFDVMHMPRRPKGPLRGKRVRPAPSGS